MSLLRAALWILGPALLAACGAPSKQVTPDYPPLESAELGSMHNVAVCDGLWFGSAPTADDLDLARRRGVQRVIALYGQAPVEGYDLRETCAALGLECISLDLDPRGPVPPGAVERVVALLGEEPRVRTLMFCDDGSRSATLFAIHRVVNEGMKLKAALVEARRSGMRPGEPEAFVEDQVARLMAAPR